MARHAAFFHRSGITSHESLFLRLPPFRPNATIWCSMTPAEAQPSNANRPRVGIPWRTTHEEAKRITTKLQFYFGSVEEAGGEPVPISLKLSADQFAAQIADMDAFVLPGGPADVSPALYGAPHHKKTHEPDANREKTDFAILEHAFSSGKPVLAICYGCQSLNVRLGGTLYQDIASELHTEIEHSRKGLPPEAPDPTHHQSIRDLGRGLRIAAVAPDGVVEAVEHEPHKLWVVGVQWHPERMKGDPLAAALFRALVQATRAAAARR